MTKNFKTNFLRYADVQDVLCISPDTLLLSDQMGRICFANERIEGLLGYSSADLIGRSIEHLVPLRFRDRHSALRRGTSITRNGKLMAQGRPIKVLHKDGREIDVEISLSMVQTDRGELIVSALRDITERRRIEESLRHSEHKLRCLYDISPLGIALTDLNGRFLEFNESFRRICDREEEELKTLDYWALTPKKYAANEAEQIESLNKKGSYGPYYKEYIRKDQTVVPVRLNGVVITDKDGQRYIWSIVEDITESNQARDRIYELAFFDQLTRLPNRSLMLDRISLAMTASARDGSHCALLFIDLDNFKKINESLGHAAGDELLKNTAQRLVANLRNDDIVARSGGDEFLLMLVGLSDNESEAAAQVETIGAGILAALNQPYLLHNASYHCTPSIGATLFQGRAVSESLLKQAEMAMYKSKETGGNVLRFFDPEMELTLLERTAMEADLRQAIIHRQFALHYQPQVSSAGSVTGAEVLLRWHHPVKGMVSPAQFIPLAEETGQILPLGNWVLETACRQLAAWSDQPDLADLTIAVNVSAGQLNQPDFVAQVLAVLDRTGANPRRLKLELTESMLASNIEEVIMKMNALRSRGLQFSLDDFGTGYSSLSYLKRLPLSQLKIDQSFVRDVLTDPNDAAIAKTVVALAHTLDLGVIAEGVETAEQQDFLARSGCHAYQGYYFSRPLPVEGFTAFVRGGPPSRPVHRAGPPDFPMLSAPC